MNAQLTNLAPRAALDLSNCVRIDRAAALMHLDAGNLRRRCRDVYAPQGRAVFASPPGGRAAWYIAREVDARLIEQPIGDLHQLPDLSGFTPRQQRDAIERMNCVKRLRTLQVTSGACARSLAILVAELRADYPNLRGVTLHSLYRWARLFNRASDLPRLVDARGCHKRDSAGDRAAWDYFRDLVTHENCLAVAHAHEQTAKRAAAEGWKWCSLKSCRRQLDTRVPAEQRSANRAPGKWRKQYRPTIAQDAEAWHAGERWIGDHKMLDLLCTFGEQIVRPWLTVWMDWRTRKVVGWAVADVPNSTTILAALRSAILDPSNLGPPKSVHVDNGRDYAAWMFHGRTKRQRFERGLKFNRDVPEFAGLFQSIGISATHAHPFNPNGKSRIERWFRFCERLSRGFDTYTGRSSELKPERLASIIKARRLVPTFETVRERAGRFIAEYNDRRTHSIDDLKLDGERLSRAAAYDRMRPDRAVVPDSTALNMLLAHWHRPVSVTRNGITIGLRGRQLHYGQFAEELIAYKPGDGRPGRQVLVAYDPADLRTIRVHDTSWRYIATVSMNGLGGMHGDKISAAHVGELNRQTRAYTRALRVAREKSIERLLEPSERLSLIAAEQRRSSEAPSPPRPVDPPRSLRIVQTPLDGQGHAMEREQLRKAVGAESIGDLPRRRDFLARLNGRIAPRPRDQFGSLIRHDE